MLFRSKGPGRNGFTVVSDIAEGTTLQPGATRTALVRFTATRPGTFRDVWSINADTPGSARSVTFTATATARRHYAFTASSKDVPGRPIASPEGSRS